METKLSARAMEGQLWKVKSTPITRKYGVDVHRHYCTEAERRMDNKAWPGEIGTVQRITWENNPEGSLALVFERERRVWVNSADLADFILVRKAPAIAEGA